MASAFGHALAACVITSFRKRSERSAKLWVWGILLSILPDIDVLAFRYGIPYTSVFGHRGFTHSIVFAVLCGLLVGFLFFREKKSSEWFKTVLILCLCMLSHGVLDALTSGGEGVGFFIPFSSERFFFAVRPIRVSPISPSRFFGERGLVILKSEALWIGGASAAVLLIRLVFGALQKKIISIRSVD